jgi:hypothetical protein
MNWKGRKWLWPNLRYFPELFLEGLNKTVRSVYHDRRWSGRDSKASSAEHEARNDTAGGSLAVFERT